MALVLSADGGVLITASDSSIQQCDTTSGKVRVRSCHAARSTPVLWRAPRQVTGYFDVFRHEGRQDDKLVSLVLSANATLVYCGSNRGVVEQWDLDKGAVSPAVGHAWQQRGRLFDFCTQQLRAFRNGEVAVKAMALSPDGLFLYASEGALIRQWNTATDEVRLLAGVNRLMTAAHAAGTHYGGPHEQRRGAGCLVGWSGCVLCQHRQHREAVGRHQHRRKF